MSTVKTDLLQNRLGTSHPAVTKGDFVKAYVPAQNTTATPIVFGTGFNIASFNDLGVGNLKINFTALFYDSPSPATLAVSQLNSAPGWDPTYVTVVTQGLTGVAVDTYIGLVVAGRLA